MYKYKYNILNNLISCLYIPALKDWVLRQRLDKKVSPHTENETHVLSKSHCLRDLKAVATVLNISKSSIEDIVKCVEYSNSKRKIDIMMINNKYVNSELQNALYRTTKDINYISQIAKDIFVF